MRVLRVFPAHRSPSLQVREHRSHGSEAGSRDLNGVHKRITCWVEGQPTNGTVSLSQFSVLSRRLLKARGWDPNCMVAGDGDGGRAKRKSRRLQKRKGTPSCRVALISSTSFSSGCSSLGTKRRGHYLSCIFLVMNHAGEDISGQLTGNGNALPLGVPHILRCCCSWDPAA